MPDDRKRSRSPSDTDEPANKRHQSAQGVATPAEAKPVKKDEDTNMTDANKTGDGTNPAPGAATQTIHMRCLIVTQDASIIIGKGGSHVNEIREKSGAKVMVSESIPGNPERILNVSGALDAVSKVSILIQHYHLRANITLFRLSVLLFAALTTSHSMFRLSPEVELSR